MIVAQAVTIKLKDSAARTLSHESYVRTQDWMKNWTPRNNFKAVIADTREEAVKALQAKLQVELVPSWLRKESGVMPDQFEFQIAYEEVKEDGFWPSLPFTLVKDFPVVPEGE